LRSTAGRHGRVVRHLKAHLICLPRDRVQLPPPELQSRGM
jgi:hypothetical protein